MESTNAANARTVREEYANRDVWPRLQIEPDAFRELVMDFCMADARHTDNPTAWAECCLNMATDPVLEWHQMRFEERRRKEGR